MDGRKAIIKVECDTFGNLMVYSNLAERNQQIEVLELALRFVRRDFGRVILTNGQKKPDKSRPF